MCFFDQHFDLFLALEYSFDVLGHHALQVFELFDEFFLLVLVLVAVEEGLPHANSTNCCLYISAKVAFISKALALAISSALYFSLKRFLISSRKTMAVLTLRVLSARHTYRRFASFTM